MATIQAKSVRRREDLRLLTGTGNYTDDVNVTGQLHAHYLRSPHARARIVSIDPSAAKRAPGVVAVYTHADLAADKINPMPVLTEVPVKSPDGGIVTGPPRHALASDEVRFVGDAVALIVATTLAQALDAPRCRTRKGRGQ